MNFNTKAFWRDILEQNEKAIKEYFHDNAYVNWHCTDEHFTVDEFIRANCEYPGEWAGEIEREERTGDLVITAVHVYGKNDESLSFHVTSFIKLENEKIISVDEYWDDDGLPPQWRIDKKIGTSIKRKQYLIKINKEQK